MVLIERTFDSDILYGCFSQSISAFYFYSASNDTTQLTRNNTVTGTQLKVTSSNVGTGSGTPTFTVTALENGKYKVMQQATVTDKEVTAGTVLLTYTSTSSVAICIYKIK